MPVGNTIIHTAIDNLHNIKTQDYINIHCQGMEIQTTVLIVPNLIYDVILGINTLAKINAIIHFKNNTLALLITQCSLLN